MSIEKVKKYFKTLNLENNIQEFETSSATVELAAQALHVESERIVKTLALKSEDSCILIAVAGDAKIDNKKFKSEFGFKPKMLSAEDTLSLTGHAVGGVCPFALPDGIKSYVDISIKRFDIVYPACGSSNSVIKLTIDEIYQYSNAEKWVDVSKARN